MTTSELFILLTVTALLLVVRFLDRRFQGRISADEAETLGRFARISRLVAKKEASADLRLKMGIRQQTSLADDARESFEHAVPA